MELSEWCKVVLSVLEGAYHEMSSTKGLFIPALSHPGSDVVCVGPYVPRSSGCTSGVERRNVKEYKDEALTAY